VYQLFASHQLKVDSENVVLGFIFHYTKSLAARHGSSRQAIAFIVDYLAAVVRYPFLSTSKVLSAYRDNEHFRQSVVFQHHVKAEFKHRVLAPLQHQLFTLNVSAN